MTSRGRHLEIKSVKAAASAAAAAVNPNVTMGVCIMMFEKFRISINCSHLKELDITRLVEIILKLTDVY